MQISEVGYEGPQPIDSYGGGGFRVADEFRPGDLMMFGPEPLKWEAGALDAAAFQAVIDNAEDIDVLLVGMGAEIRPLPGEARAALEAAGIGVEIMATPAACRTYNVLLAEDRRVAVAVVAI